MIEQHVGDLGLAVRPHAFDGLLRIEGVGERIGSELGDHIVIGQFVRGDELRDGHSEGDGVHRWRFDDDAHVAVRPLPALARTVDVP